MATKYYSDLYEIEDSFRKKKLLKLLTASLQNDMMKWSQEILQKSLEPRYISPDYNGSRFFIEITSYYSFAYIKHKPPVQSHESELITDKFSSELQSLVDTMCQKIFTPEIYEIEKLIGNQHSRKEKLDTLELEQVKEIVDDT